MRRYSIWSIGRYLLNNNEEMSGGPLHVQVRISKLVRTQIVKLGDISLKMVLKAM